LSFDLSSSSITHAGADPFDNLLGGTLDLASMQVIGVQEDGTMHLATSRLTVSKSGANVLHGYVVELAYMPSSVPGYAAMIEGYLDVPPADTGAGIQNGLGSSFLAGYQQALDDADAVRRSTFWFFSDQPLFDAAGNIVGTSSTGKLVFGVALPEPSARLLLLSGAAVVMCRRRRGLNRAST
jgi:hypothetical protein